MIGRPQFQPDDQIVFKVSHQQLSHIACRHLCYQCNLARSVALGQAFSGALPLLRNRRFTVSPVREGGCMDLTALHEAAIEATARALYDRNGVSASEDSEEWENEYRKQF